MTDMRATEQLLAYLVEQLDALEACHDRIRDGDAGALGDAIADSAKLRQAADELGRRGDTLVRLSDLRLVRQAVDLGRLDEPSERSIRAALSRIDASLGEAS